MTDSSGCPRTVLITGALSDIGRATAAAFAAAGYCVALNYRSRPEQAAVLVDRIRREHPACPGAAAIRADVRVRAEVRALFEEAGPVGVLVNNAGINRDKPFLEMTDGEWDLVLDTVLGGTFLCSQEFARRFRGTGGNIVNIGSVSALRGRRNGVNYCAARAGILTLTKCLALELAPDIRVNTVTPGRIDTEELRARYRYMERDNRAEFEQDIPLRRLGAPEDVAKMILFLADQGGYVTGQNFLVDGGLLMR
jgi:3-oxoacyl-[acyl-carrier protein] reductase